MTPRPPQSEEDIADEDAGKPLEFVVGQGVNELPYEFEEFKDKIDPRSGFYSDLPSSVDDLEDDVELSLDEDRLYVFRQEFEEYVQGQLHLAAYIKSYGVTEYDTEWTEANPYRSYSRN